VDHAWWCWPRAAASAATESYLYGKNRAVLTQRQLEDKLAQGGLPQAAEPQVVMIQCVDSRNEKRIPIAAACAVPRR